MTRLLWCFERKRRVAGKNRAWIPRQHNTILLFSIVSETAKCFYNKKRKEINQAALVLLEIFMIPGFAEGWLAGKKVSSEEKTNLARTVLGRLTLKGEILAVLVFLLSARLTDDLDQLNCSWRPLFALYLVLPWWSMALRSFESKIFSNHHNNNWWRHFSQGLRRVLTFFGFR